MRVFLLVCSECECRASVGFEALGDCVSFVCERCGEGNLMLLDDQSSEADPLPPVDLSCHLCRRNPCECQELERHVRENGLALNNLDN